MNETTHEGRIRLANNELLDKGNSENVQNFFTADYLVHTGGKEFTGLEFIQRFVNQLRRAIPDLCVIKVDILIHGENTVAWQRTMRGTHTVAHKGIPASGKRITWQDMMISRFEGERIAEEWAVSDLAGQMMIALSKN